MRETSFNENAQLSYIDNGLSIKSSKELKRKTYLHFPALSCPEDLKIFPKCMHSDFEPIFYIASFIGITFTMPPEDPAHPHVRTNAVKKVYDIIINLLCVLSLAITLAFEHNFAASKAMALTYFIKYLACFVIRCNLICRNSKIPQVITTLSQLYCEVSSSIYESLRVKIYFECLGMLFLNILLLTVTTLRIIREAKILNMPVLTIFGHNLTTTDDGAIVHGLIIAHGLNYFFTVFTVSACLLACFNVHIILHRLVMSYGQTLLESIKSNTTKDGFTEDFVTFRRIMYGISAADDALSVVTFFLYATCISCFFHTVSSCLASEDFFSQPYFAAEVILLFLFSVFIFTSFTYSATAVSTAGDDLKQRVVCASEIILKKNLPSDALLSFMILFDNIKCSNTGMTGWGMFMITKAFVLSTVGVMITYGVLLFQFG